MWITSKRNVWVWAVILAFLLAACSVRQRSKPEVYQCGFVMARKKAVWKFLEPELQVLDLRPGQVVADVGASNGFHMGMVSVFTDSLTIYLEDIDSLCLNPDELEKVRDWYTWVREEPLSNQFHLVLGTETETRLPEATFDKILITAAFHHFSDPQGMLADLKGKLRPEGHLYIIENVVETSGEIRKSTCRHPLRSAADLQSLFEQNGFRLESVRSLHRDWTKIFVLSPEDR